MQLNLGNKIRELRHRDGRTQEVLAEALGVTAQAVSRWESGGSYPDMEIIPAIANYFHISIDELFGYHDDREQKIKGILEAATAVMSRQGFLLAQGYLSDDVEECIRMLRAAAEEFPNEPKILLKLAEALHRWGWHKYGARVQRADGTDIIEYDAEYNAKNEYWQEAVRVYEKLLKLDPPPKDREIAIHQLTQMYCRMGEYEKALALANAQNSLIISRELLLAVSAKGEEKARYHGERIMALLSNLEFAFSESLVLCPAISPTEYAKEVRLAVIKLYETVFNDGRCGKWHWALGRNYLHLAKYEASGGNLQRAVDYFDKGFAHCKEYEHICQQEEEYCYSAPLVCHLMPPTKEELSPMEKEFWAREISTYPQSLREALSQNEKYAECFA